MSLAGQATSQIAPSGMSSHEGVVLGLLALIVFIRLIESGRFPAAWSAVFGGSTAGTSPAPGKPNPANVAPGTLQAP